MKKYGTYQNLSKEEKKFVRDEYVRTEKGEAIIKRLNRAIVYSIVYILISIGITIGFIIGFYEWWYMIFAVACLACFFVFFFGQRKIRLTQYCKFIVIKKKAAEKYVENLKKKKQKS